MWMKFDTEVDYNMPREPFKQDTAYLATWSDTAFYNLSGRKKKSGSEYKNSLFQWSLQADVCCCGVRRRASILEDVYVIRRLKIAD